MTTTPPIVGLPQRRANLETAREKYGYKVDFMIEMLQVAAFVADRLSAAEPAARGA